MADKRRNLAIPSRRQVLAGFGAVTLAGLAGPARADALAAAKAGGHVILMRHAIAPGTGDPETFDVNDRTTQRILSEEGRAQARRTGDALRAAGVPVDRVLTSQWWRCEETALLLDMGPVEPFPEALNSFFRRPGERDGRVAALTGFIRGWRGAGNALCVTHQVNITGTTGVFPASGELVVVAPQGVAVAGRLGPY